MDLNILIAALGVLVAVFAETRSAWKDKTKDQIKPIGINLLQLIFALDEIIKCGNELLHIIAFVPLTQGDKSYLASIKSKQWDILKIIEKQQKSLERFNQIYESSMRFMDGKTSISVGKAIEFYVPDKAVEIPNILIPKITYLRVLTWKLLESQTSFSRLSVAARVALKNLERPIKVEKHANYLSVKFPQKVMIKEGYGRNYDTKVDKQETITYDLQKPKDLRLLLENAKNQLDEIRNLRKQLADFATTSFSLDELLKSQ